MKRNDDGCQFFEMMFLCPFAKKKHGITAFNSPLRDMGLFVVSQNPISSHQKEETEPKKGDFGLLYHVSKTG